MYTAANKPPPVIFISRSSNLCSFDGLVANLHLVTLQIAKLTEEHLAQAGDIAAMKKRKAEEAVSIGGAAQTSKKRKKNTIPTNAQVINLDGATVTSSA